MATARASNEQQANDIFNELKARVSQEANATAVLRGSLTQAQREAPAEACELYAATKKTGNVES